MKHSRENVDIIIDELFDFYSDKTLGIDITQYETMYDFLADHFVAFYQVYMNLLDEDEAENLDLYDFITVLSVVTEKLVYEEAEGIE